MCLSIKDLFKIILELFRVLKQLDTNKNVEWIEPESDGGKPPDNISSQTLLHAVTGITKPKSGGSGYEPREDNFEKETDKCNAVKFCENLTEAHNCGYCLQDDLEGQHPFHYGNENYLMSEFNEMRSKIEYYLDKSTNFF